MYLVYTDDYPRWLETNLGLLVEFFEGNKDKHGYEWFEDWLTDMERFDLIRRSK